LDQHASDLAGYFQREAMRKRPYGGQLTAEFQASLAAHHANVTPEDCDFYHSFSLPDGRSFQGDWDLRGHERDYLGDLDFNGKSVIEYGPASGYLTRAMVQAGAAVTVFDLPFGSSPEIMPFPGADPIILRQSGARSTGRLRNSWWFARRELKFAARAVYGDIYNQPDDLGTYDIALFGAILVHLSNPFLALREAAALARRTIVVTDLLMLPPMPEFPGLLQLGTSPPPIGHVHWWNFSASVFQVILTRLGFGRQSIKQHSPIAMANRPPMMTIVAHRD
jgi:hypothetical protein